MGLFWSVYCQGLGFYSGIACPMTINGMSSLSLHNLYFALNRFGEHYAVCNLKTNSSPSCPCLPMSVCFLVRTLRVLDELVLL